jgi:hypothetical protein
MSTSESVRLVWHELAGGAMADGRENVYLIWTTGPEGMPVDVRFTRWRRATAELPAEALAVARQALANAVVLPLGRGPGRPAGTPEAVLSVAFAKGLLQGYEDGVVTHGFGVAWGQLPLADDDSEAQARAAEQLAVFGEPHPGWHLDRSAAGLAAGARWGREHGNLLGFETGAPWRSAAEADWDESRGD